MHEFFWFFFLFAMFCLFTLKPGRVRACHFGRWSGAEAPAEESSERPRHRRPRGNLHAALAERDALIAKLEERVRVLERIATDDSARLRAEIESLRDAPPADRK